MKRTFLFWSLPLLVLLLSHNDHLNAQNSSSQSDSKTNVDYRLQKGQTFFSALQRYSQWQTRVHQKKQPVATNPDLPPAYQSPPPSAPMNLNNADRDDRSDQRGDITTAPVKEYLKLETSVSDIRDSGTIRLNLRILRFQFSMSDSATYGSIEFNSKPEKQSETPSREYRSAFNQVAGITIRAALSPKGVFQLDSSFQNALHRSRDSLGDSLKEQFLKQNIFRMEYFQNLFSLCWLNRNIQTSTSDYDRKHQSWNGKLKTAPLPETCEKTIYLAGRHREEIVRNGYTYDLFDVTGCFDRCSEHKNTKNSNNSPGTLAVDKETGLLMAYEINVNEDGARTSENGKKRTWKGNCTVQFRRVVRE